MPDAMPPNFRSVTPLIVAHDCARAIDRAGRTRDPFGHNWGLGMHVEDVPDDEMEARMKAFYEDKKST